jgi:hypothetical protein
MEAISAMAKTSEESRLKLFPALMNCLDSPPECALQTIAQGMYNSIGNENESGLISDLSVKSCFSVWVCVCG